MAGLAGLAAAALAIAILATAALWPVAAFPATSRGAAADPYKGLRAFAGDTHVHTGLAIYRVLDPNNPHSIGTPDEVLDVAEARGLDFVVITEHSNNVNDPRGVEWRQQTGNVFTYPNGQTTASEWTYLQSSVEAHTKPGRFIPFVGLEYTNGENEKGMRPGHQTGAFPGTTLPRYCSNFPHNVGDCPTNQDFFKFVKEQGGVAIMAHPCANWGFSDWSEYDPVVNAMEIVAGKCEFAPSGYNDVLKRGLRIGARGSSDSHRFGVGGNDKTMCFAKELSRPAILDAMKRNLCYYADEFPITLKFSINGVPMGGDVVDDGSGISVTVAATSEWEADFDHLELIHDGVVAQRTPCEDPEYLNCSMKSYIASGTAGYYYVALSNQNERRLAISSPIWVRAAP